MCTTSYRTLLSVGFVFATSSGNVVSRRVCNEACKEEEEEEEGRETSFG